MKPNTCPRPVSSQQVEQGVGRGWGRRGAEDDVAAELAADDSSASTPSTSPTAEDPTTNPANVTRHPPTRATPPAPQDAQPPCGADDANEKAWAHRAQQGVGEPLSGGRSGGVFLGLAREGWDLAFFVARGRQVGRPSAGDKGNTTPVNARGWGEEEGERVGGVWGWPCGAHCNFNRLSVAFNHCLDQFSTKIV